MPVYAFACDRCGRGQETYCSVADRPRTLPCGCGGTAARVYTAPMVMPDIQPYRAVAGDMAGKPITSRREHREYLKRNGLVEVGNEQPKPRKPVPLPPVHEDIKRAIAEVRSR